MEVDDEVFKEKLMHKRHREIVDALKSIKVPEQKDNSELIVKFNSAIAELTDKLSKLESPKIVTEKTTINQTEVVNSLKELIKEMKSLKPLLTKEESPKEWVFTVNRNFGGFIQSVTAKQIE